MLDRLLDHKADEHFFEEVHAPIFYLCIELLRRNIEKVSQLLGVVEPEKVRKRSRNEHLERDEIALAKLVMKEGEKPGKFLLPHGIILLEFGPYRIFMEGNPEGIQNQRPLGIMELSERKRLSLHEWMPMLPWPVCPLAGHAPLGQNVVVESMLVSSESRWGTYQEEYTWTPIFITCEPYH